MNISIYQKEAFEKYKSKSQIARVLTENWLSQEMYCPSCLKDELNKSPNNTKVIDFYCVKCFNEFQLKSQANPFHSRILDGSFNPMMDSIIKKTNPNFFLMNYSNEEWKIKYESLDFRHSILY